MAKEEVLSSIPQRINVKFIINEEVKPTLIRTQFNNDPLSRMGVFDLAKKYKGT